jgi:hypothetical protein
MEYNRAINISNCKYGILNCSLCNDMFVVHYGSVNNSDEMIMVAVETDIIFCHFLILN